MEGSSRALSPQARRVLEQYKDTPPPPTVKKKETKRVWFLSAAKRPGQRGTDITRIHPAPQPLPDSTSSRQQPQQQPELQHDDLPSFAPAISPLLTQRTAAAQGWPLQPMPAGSEPTTRDRANTSSPPVDYVHAPTSRIMSMFEPALENRYRDYWYQSYSLNARRGILASLLLSFVVSVLSDAYNTVWSAAASGGVSEFIRFFAMRLCGLAIIGLCLVLFRRVQPEQWGYSVWPRWTAPIHVVSLLFVIVYWAQASFVAVHQVEPGDVSLNLGYSLLLILIPSQCATLFHIHHVLLAGISVSLLITSIVLTVVYTTPDVVLLVVYAVAVVVSHTVYIVHAHRENARTRQEFLSFCQLQQEEEVNQRLLLKMLPLSIIHKLRGGAEYVYEKYERVSVLFSHIDDFDLHTASMQPIQLVRTLNKLFSLFDALTDEHRVYKVETIGDVFLVSSGCPAEHARDDHASALCVLAVDMMAVVKAFKVRHDETRRTSIRLMNTVPQLFSRPSVSGSLDDDRTGLSLPSNYSSSSSSSATAASSSRLSHSSLDLRIGINTGPVIAGVVGVKYPRYRLMGDTINTASRMSTTCERGEIQLSAATYGELNAADFVCQQRSRVEVKGKGLMQTYILKEHKLSHRTSATKVVQAKLGQATNEQPLHFMSKEHARTASTLGNTLTVATAVLGRGQSSQSLSQRPVLLSGEGSARIMTDRQRKAQQAIDAVTHSTQETLSDSPLLRPAIKKASSFFGPPLNAAAEVSSLLSDDGGLRVMSAYSGQDELADMIRAKSAQVVHLVPAAHRMSVSTAASSEVDNERMLQSAPVSAVHSREPSQGTLERHMATHVYPASAPLTPHESMEPDIAAMLLQPPKPERALTESLATTASIATTITNTHSSLSLPNSALPSAHLSSTLSSTHSSMNELSAVLHSSTADPPSITPVPSSTSLPVIAAIISSSATALSAPTFPAPPLASLASAGTLRPKTSISSSLESPASSQLRDPPFHTLSADTRRSPFLSSRTAFQLSSGEAAPTAAVDRPHRLGSHGSYDSLSSASSAASVDEARDSARGSVLAPSDAMAPPAALRASSVSQFPGTPSSIERSRTATLSTPEMSPRDGPPLSQPSRLPALVIPHSLAQPRPRHGSRESELASTPSSASSIDSPVSAMPLTGFHGGGASGGGPVSADVNQSVHPSHLTNSGIDFSPNTHYRFLLPSPSQLPRDVRESRAPVSPLAAANNNSARPSSRAVQPHTPTNATDSQPATIATPAPHGSPSLLATVLRARGDSKTPLIAHTAASNTATVSPLPALTPGLPIGRRRQRDVVITAHSQRVRTTKMFTYGDADALLHPPRPWLAKLSLTFITDARLENEFGKEREGEEVRDAFFWTITTLCGLVCCTVYEEIALTRSEGVDVAVWLLRLLAAVCQLVLLWVLRDERRRAWRQRALFVAATVWCCTFIVNSFLQSVFLHVYGLSILLFSFSIITLFCSLHISWAFLSVLTALLCWLLTGLALDRCVSPIILFHLSACCLYLGSSYSTEYRDRSSFLRFRRHANEKQTTQNFLANLLPPSVIRSLTLTHSAFIAHERLMADVLFCDVVQFTALAARSSPEDVVAILNVLFSSFDAMTDKYHVYKVETIGDAYLACSGVVEERDDHTKLLVECGLAMRRVTRLFRTPDHQPIVVRIGIHSGFVIAGVVGRKMPRYHLFGETVSIAEEMEQRAPAGQVIISEATLRGMTVEQWKLFDFAPLEPIRIAAPSDAKPNSNQHTANTANSSTNGAVVNTAPTSPASLSTTLLPTTATSTTDSSTPVRLIKRYMVRSARSAQLQREREGKATASTQQVKRHRMMHARSNTMTQFDRVLLTSGGGGAGGAAAVLPIQRANTLKKLSARGSSLMDSELSSVKSSERGNVIPGTATGSARSSTREEPSEGSEAEEKKE